MAAQQSGVAAAGWEKAAEHGAPAPASHPVERTLVDFIVRRRYARDAEFAHTSHHIGPLAPDADEVDYLFLTENEPHRPEDVFDRLRWGGQVVYVSRDMRRVIAAAEAFEEWRRGELDGSRVQEGGGSGAWVIEERAGTEKKYFLHLRLLGLRRTRVHFMAARKVMLVPPGNSSDRFTYNVYLEKDAQGAYEVVKEVPTIERVLARLEEKFPEAEEETLRRRAKKFTEKIFPVFLTREAAMLKLLHRDLPKRFRNRVPRLIAAEQDRQGYVIRLRMKWLRNGLRHARGGGHPLSQLEFAHQAAELLAALHDDVGVMHLDLRLDNFVITEHGVGFVDFGSAVRVGEAFAEASLLSNLFGEMMRTSQIQRMMGKMTARGEVTSEEIRAGFNKIDKAADFFYLAVQINAPHSNPDFKGLVSFDKHSREARELATLTEEILRPTDPRHARFKSAREILHGIEEIERRLAT